MNTKQSDTWWELVHQCEIQCTKPYYSSINVASQIRSEAIVAAGNLVELVTVELAELLERLGKEANLSYEEAGEAGDSGTDWAIQLHADDKAARALAARIREALALEADND